MRIGELARQASCTVPTIRFYEASGLMPTAMRLESGHRIYGRKDLTRLQFVRRARDFGMSVGHIRQLLEVSAESSTACRAAREIVQLQLIEIRAKRRDLAKLEASLQMMAERCDETCGRGSERPCTIFDDIGAQPGTCCPA
jgi:DNA-binding transcriptional MerR regulator